jgi:hypothetical protein
MTQSNLFELSHFFSAIFIKNKHLLFMLFLYIYYLTIAKSQPLEVIYTLTPYSLSKLPLLQQYVDVGHNQQFQNLQT